MESWPVLCERSLRTLKSVQHSWHLECPSGVLQLFSSKSFRTKTFIWQSAYFTFQILTKGKWFNKLSVVQQLLTVCFEERWHFKSSRRGFTMHEAPFPRPEDNHHMTFPGGVKAALCHSTVNRLSSTDQLSSFFIQVRKMWWNADYQTQHKN